MEVVGGTNKVDKFVSPAELKVGQVISGFYLDYFETESEKYKGTISRSYRIKLEADGSVIGLRGCTMLDKRLPTVASGTYVDITYHGKAGPAQTDPHRYSVQQEVKPEASDAETL